MHAMSCIISCEGVTSPAKRFALGAKPSPKGVTERVCTLLFLRRVGNKLQVKNISRYKVKFCICNSSIRIEGELQSLESREFVIHLNKDCFLFIRASVTNDFCYQELNFLWRGTDE